MKLKQLFLATVLAVLGFVAVSVLSVPAAADKPPFDPNKSAWAPGDAPSPWNFDSESYLDYIYRIEQEARDRRAGLEWVKLDECANTGDRVCIETIVWKLFGNETPRVLGIMQRESGFNPRARNASGASGLMQTMLPLHNNIYYSLGYNDPWNQSLDALANLRVAHALWDGANGYGHWVLTDHGAIRPLTEAPYEFTPRRVF